MFPAVCTACQTSLGIPRALASMCVALIIALGVFAVSPGLHRQLHDAGAATAEDECVIILFANGVSVPLAMVAMVPPAAEWRKPPQRLVLELLLDSPRYLLRPERGPPLA